MGDILLTPYCRVGLPAVSAATTAESRFVPGERPKEFIPHEEPCSVAVPTSDPFGLCIDTDSGRILEDGRHTAFPERSNDDDLRDICADLAAFVEHEHRSGECNPEYLKDLAERLTENLRTRGIL